MEFLPLNRNEEGCPPPDFVLVTGDAYADHPSFGAAVISRILEDEGFSVGIIAQPDIRKDEDFKGFGKPRLGFLITSGNPDSMVNNFTVAKKRRKEDVYSPGGKYGLRPDRALTEYGKKIRRIFKSSPIILGGLEASLRRLAHYDYWADRIMPSVLLDAKADLLVYGMGELQTVEIAHALKAGISISDLTYIEGTVYKTGDVNAVAGFVSLPPYKELVPGTESAKKRYAESFLIQHQNTDNLNAACLAEEYDGLWVVQNIPARPLTQPELDRVYELPYTRLAHPSYEKAGGIPALEEVSFSIASSRGCFGGCNFCALSHHQGRAVRSRSHESILKEAEALVKFPGFKGYIHDVGGPTANFRKPSCKKQLRAGMCKNRKCLTPKPCPELIADHSDYLSLLRKIRELDGIKKVFVRSGIRFDYLLYDKNDEFFHELVRYHISGQLKIAPEHIAPNTLEKMGKPQKEVYDKFIEKYEKINKKYGMKQFVVPYLMSSHPGSTLKDAVKLAEYLRDKRINPKQVQDFYPTPSQLSTCMYYTGIDPYTGKKVYSAKTPHEKAMHRALIQYRLPQNYALVYEALKKAGRTDLIGFDKKCLIKPKFGEATTGRKEDGNVERIKRKKSRVRNTERSKAKSGGNGKKADAGRRNSGRR